MKDGNRLLPISKSNYKTVFSLEGQEFNIYNQAPSGMNDFFKGMFEYFVPKGTLSFYSCKFSKDITSLMGLIKNKENQKRAKSGWNGTYYECNNPKCSTKPREGRYIFSHSRIRNFFNVPSGTGYL